MNNTVNESALAWLQKQLKSKEMGLYRAIHKVNATEQEKKNLEDAIEVIRYLIDLVTVGVPAGSAREKINPGG
jgi:DNA transposition AAA+ family ATPase